MSVVPLINSVVKITDSKLSVRGFGTCFAVYRDQHFVYLLTCAHVIESIGGIEEVRVAGSKAEQVISGQEKGVDLAILTVKNECLPNLPLLSLRQNVEEKSSIRTAGFRVVTDKDIVCREITGTLIGRNKLGSEGFSEQISGWDFEVDLTQSIDVLQPGCSGSPLVDNSGQVVGIVAIRGKQDREKGIAIAVEALRSIWPSSYPDIFSKKDNLDPTSSRKKREENSDNEYKKYK
jgi:S1-C subfamily serine protease